MADDLEALGKRIAILERRLERERKIREETERIAEEQIRTNYFTQRELEARNRALEQFAYATSHDLRAPLRGVRTYLEILAEELEGVSTWEMTAMSSKITDAVDRMDRLLTGLLRYATNGRTVDDAESIALAPLVAEVCDLIAPPETFDIEVVGDAEVVAPRAVVAQVFQNLIDNAIKHHHGTHGHVVVELGDRDPQSVEWIVRDDGPGIAPVHHARIFQLFAQLDRNVTTGSGVGLALVKQHVDACGGSISVESTPGDGAAFRIVWPREWRPALSATPPLR